MMKCKQHTSANATAYCETDRVFLCDACKNNPTHKKHQEKPLSAFLAEERDAQTEFLEELEKQEEEFRGGSKQFQEEIKSHNEKQRAAYQGLEQQLKGLCAELPSVIADFVQKRHPGEAIHDLAQEMQDWGKQSTTLLAQVKSKSVISPQSPSKEQHSKIEEMRKANAELQELLKEKHTDLEAKRGNILRSLKDTERLQVAFTHTVSEHLDNLRRSLKQLNAAFDLEDIAKTRQAEQEPPLPLVDFQKPIVHFDPRTSLLTVYDLATQARTQPPISFLTPVPIDAQSVLVERTLFISGGRDQGSSVSAKTFGVELLVDMRRAIPKAEMLEAKVAHTLVALDKSNIMSLGGMNSNYPIKSCEIFDIDKNVWCAAPSLTTSKKRVTACVFPFGAPDAILYAFGGIYGKSSVDTIEMLNLSQGEDAVWTVLEIPDNTFSPCFAVGACSTPEGIVIFGGWPEHEIWLFNPTALTIVNQGTSEIQGDFSNSSCVCEQNKLFVLDSLLRLCTIDLLDFSSALQAYPPA
jgi:hypothetical protein